MPLSVGGGQLPLSAFFGSSGSSGKRSTKPRVASKRKGSPLRGHVTEPARKKRKQKENVVLSSDQILPNVTGNLESPPSTSKARRRPSSSSSGDIEDALMELNDGPEANICTGDPLIDLTVDGSDDITNASAPKHVHNLKTPPLTPDVQDRRRDFESITSLPSPPLTAPDARRGRRKRAEENEKQEDTLELPQVSSTDRGTRPGTVDAKKIDNPSLCGSSSQVLPVKHDISSSFLSSQGGRDLMPPPPLPLKVLLSSSAPQSTAIPMPRPPPSHGSRSIYSKEWVPSSQTQELTIPHYEDLQDQWPSNTARLAHSGRPSQIVPSSQLSERELELFHDSPVNSSSSSPLLMNGSGKLASVAAPTTPTTPTTPATHSDLESPVTHEVVESSQSQFETEITAAWAETLATRREALRWPKETSSSFPLSSPPRVVQSQDYDAESEWSPSIDEVSQSLRTSPLQLPSQPPSGECSSSYAGSDAGSYSALPSQMRRFLETFEGRDEDGNELPRDLGAGPARPRSSSPSHDRGHEPRQRGSGPSLLSSESQLETWDGITASPPAIPKDYISDGGSSYGSSFPSTMPTPLRNFLEMFPDTQTQDHVEVESSHFQDEDTYDL